jgi:hypothetical protein
VSNCFISYQNEDQIVKMQIYITVFMNSSPLYHDYSFFSMYNLYFIVCCNLAMSERLLSGIFTKEQSFSGGDNSKNTGPKAPFQTPHL